MKIIIEDINLVDDASSKGGKANANETLAEFLGEAEPESYSLKDINNELKACGIEPINLDQIIIKRIEEE